MTDSYVVFETPGAFDLRALKTFGINSKPHTYNPIGYFGTGLKYAVAILMRTGHKLSIVTGGKRLDFNCQQDSFREKQFDFIFVNGEQLPFTTELGKNWELWQAFRELYSNTLDESGRVYSCDAQPAAAEDMTQIIVEGEDFVREFDARDETFLPDALRTGLGVQILPRPSSKIYYRGMRVADTPKPSLFTYNILNQINLTEDRTAVSQWQVAHYIAEAMVASSDERFLRDALNADENWYESRIDFSEMWQIPSEVFATKARTARNRTAFEFARKHDPSWLESRRSIHPFDQMAECIKQEEWNMFLAVAQENRNELLALLLGGDRSRTGGDNGQQN